MKLMKYAARYAFFLVLAFCVPFFATAQDEVKFLDPETGLEYSKTGANVLCFTTRNVRVKVTGAESECTWTVGTDSRDYLSVVNQEGDLRDNITLLYSPSADVTRQLSVTVSWRKDDGSNYRETLYFVAPCQASQPGEIFIYTRTGDNRIGHDRSTDDRNREVYCERLNYSLEVAEGPTPEGGYSSSSPLQYGWFIAPTATELINVQELRDFMSGSDKNSILTPVSVTDTGKYWMVKAKTCDDGYRTKPSAQKIENVILKNILPTNVPLTVTHIRYGMKSEGGSGEGGDMGGGGMGGGIGGGMGGDEEEFKGPAWFPISQTADADEMENIACVFYSNDFNGKSKNNNLGNGEATGAVNMGESVSGYIDLEAGPFDLQDDILFPHYRFNWIFDTADLEIATDKMATDPRRCADSGFGADRVRICFKVKEKKLSKEDSLAGKTRDKIRVSVEVFCPECEAEAAKNGQTDTEYRKSSADLVLTRVDSLPAELPYTTILRDAVGDPIDYDKRLPELCGLTPHQFCASPDKDYDGRLTFMWVKPSDAWEDGEAQDGCQGLTTPEITLTETHFGDTCRLYVYPRNQCFTNGSLDIHRDTVTVYVKALPPAPRVYDPLDTQNPNFTGVKEDEIGDEMDGKFKGRASILLCNYNKEFNGYRNRDYYLISENSPIKPQKYADHAKEGGYVLKLPEGYTDADISYEIRSLDGSTEANDTNIITIYVKEDAYAKLYGKKQLAFGLAAANECGEGSALYFPVNIIDTLNVFAHVKQLHHSDPGLDSTAWACEGEVWRWQLEGAEDRYETHPLVKKEEGGGMGGGGSYMSGAERNTDRVDYVWGFTDPTWHFLQKSSEGANPTSVVFGSGSGQVMLSLGNRCGTGSPRKGDYVNVNPFTRVKIKVTGTEIEDTRRDAYDPDLAQGDPGAAPNQEFLVEPCRDSRLVYAADTSYLTEEYLWIFPSDWEVLSEPGYETATWIGEGDSTHCARTQNTGLINPNAGIDEMRVMVRVGADTGDILVIGKKAGCHFAYDNVAPDLSRDELPYGHRADTLRVLVRPFTGKPSPQDWPADLCARLSETLVVAPDPTQDAKTKAQTYFTWSFPEDWTVDFRNDRHDTVDVSMPDRITKDTTINGSVFRSDTVKVYSHRRDCEPTNQSDSLIYAFRLVDTLPLDPESRFLDLQTRGVASLTPCEGDTVEYSLFGNQHKEIDSIVFYWNDSHDFVTGDSIDLTGWRVLNPKGKYSGNPMNVNAAGLKMVVGRAPLRISARSAAYCGESSPTQYIDITPISLVRDKADWIEGGDLLCEKEGVVFRHDSITHATAYEWHYPWGVKLDTAKVGQKGYIRRTFPDTTAFAKGEVYVVPFNTCGRGPESEKINITDIIGHLNAPASMTLLSEDGVAKNVELKITGDTVFDTVCLRHTYAYKAAYSDSRYPAQSAWKFDWFGLRKLSTDSLSVQAADSSEALLFKRTETAAPEGFSTLMLGVRVRHEKCRLYGDTLVLKILPYDTAASRTSLDYIIDLETQKADIQTKPCGAATAQWKVDKDKFVPALTAYQFVWSSDKTGQTSLGRRWSSADNSMDGSAFEWLNGKTESVDPNEAFYAEDILHFNIPNFLEHPDSLRVAVNVKSRCGVSHLPYFVVKSEEALTGKEGISVKAGSNANYCDREELVFEATANSHVNKRVWYFPWNKEGDTITGESKVESTPFSDTLTEGWVYFMASNGCGEAPSYSDSIYIENIKRIPAAPRNPSLDSLCMNQPKWLRAEFPTGTHPDNVEILWTKLRGEDRAGVFAPRQNTDSCLLAPTDVKAEGLRISVKSRVKGCNRYSDSLVIDIFSMDTLAFVIPGEDEVLGDFDLDLTQTLVAGGNPVNLTPCGGSKHTYGIRVDPAKAWSIDKDFESYLSWNREGNAPKRTPDENMSLDGTNWAFDYYSGADPDLPQYAQLPLVVGASDPIFFHVTLKNRCGVSRSQGLQIVPDRTVTQKPRIIEQAFCLGEPTTLGASNLQDVVESLVWTFPWEPRSATVGRGDVVPVTVGPENGDIIVWAGNHCGQGMSDTLHVDAVMQTPQRPEPDWLPEGKPYTWKDADTLVEYACLHGGSTFKVKHGQGDGAALQFEWNWEGGTNMSRPANGAVSDSYTVEPNAMATLADSALISVRGRYPNCGGPGPMLYIRVRLIDTLPASSMGVVDYKTKSGESGAVLCPDAELLFSVQNQDPGVSYHWNLPGAGSEGAWRIKNPLTGNPNLAEELQFPVPGDSNHSSIVAIVGEMGGRVSVQVRTSTSVLGCPYFTRPVELNTDFMVRTRPDAPVFGGTFVQRPCVGQETDYAIEPVTGAKMYRWQIPAGWKFKVNAGSVRQDTIWEVHASEADATRCTLTVGQDTGYIRVWAVDSCNGGPAVGVELSRIVYPQDTARLTVIGSHSACVDSTIDLMVRGDGVYIPQTPGSGDFIVTASGPGYGGPDKFEIRPGVTPDILYATSHTFDSVYLTFTPVFAACPDNVEPYVHFILGDTTPEIKGFITGAETVCTDNLYEYEFNLAPEMGDLDITCTWVVASDAWEVVEKIGEKKLVLRFKDVPVDSAGKPVRTVDTLVCYPRGICGTGLPVKLAVKMQEADAFNDEVVVSATRPCLGTEIEVHLRGRGLYVPYPDSIKFVWNTPARWQRLSSDGLAPATDSLPSTRYRVQTDTAAAVIEVRMWRKGACGLSQTLRSTPVKVRDSAAKATIDPSSTLHPCYTRTAYNVVLAPKDDVDSAIWTLPGGLTLSLSTRAGAAFLYDSLWIDNPDRSLTPVSLPVRTVNECGTRDTVFVLRPITRIEPFSDHLHLPRLCPGDTAYAWITRPALQIEQEDNYIWNLGEGNHTFLKQWSDSVAVMQYLVSPEGDSVHIRVTAVNDCAADSSQRASAAPYIFHVWPLSDPDTAVYGQSGVKLLVDSVAPGRKDDYTYVWTPVNRVVMDAADPTAEDAEIVTGTLVQAVETFYVLARQVAEAGRDLIPYYRRDRLCAVLDSVEIPVDSVFSFVPFSADTVCVDLIDSIFAHTFGGNRQNYRLQWYENIDDTLWMPIPELQDSVLFAPVFEVPGSYRYRVVGFDSTFLRDEVADSLIMVVSHYDTLDFRIQVYDLEAYFRNIASDEVAVPMGGRVEFLTQVENGSGNYRFHWTPESWVYTLDSLTGNMNTTALFREGEMTLTVVDSSSGCVREASVRIVPGRKNDIPNVITPNGDGYNDIFLKGVSRLTIYTSWGEKIFHTAEGIGWDGTRDGRPVRPDEYLYVAEIDGEDGSVRTVKGVVTVKYE